MHTRMNGPIALLAAFAAGSLAATQLSAQVASDSSRRVVFATQRVGDLMIDGRLDEAEWQRATPATNFRQRQPNEGSPSTQRSEVRLLYDDDALYVGAWLYDTHPDSILSLLARRDESTPSDEFFANFDSFRDRRTAFSFAITPGGVKTDQLIYDGNQIDVSWNAVWDGATSRDTAGWYVEYRIPFSQLPFSMPSDGAITWNVGFFRWIARNREDSQWSLVPQTASAWVSYFGELRGIRLRGAPRRAELLPYTLARGSRGGLARATERRLLSATAGADARVGLTPNLNITATVNPDFGQIEADPSEVNLTAFETFLAERRPFFVEGANRFRFATSEWYDAGGELFYSRRIGRSPQGQLPENVDSRSLPTTTTILGAAKLSGRTSNGWSLGILDAVTAEERARYLLPTGTTYSAAVEPRTNYAVARVARDFRGGESAVGAIATTVHRRLGGDTALALLRSSAIAAAADGRHRFGHSQYELSGWMAATQVRGSAESISATQRSSTHYLQRPDASYFAYDSSRTSLSGSAFGVRAAKVAGNWIPQLTLRAFSPGYEVNDLGFHQRSGLVVQYTNIGYTQPRQGHYLRSWWAYANFWNYWEWGGMLLTRRYQLDAQTELRNGWTTRATLVGDVAGHSADALRGGPSLAVPAFTELRTEVSSDSRRPLSFRVGSRIGREHDGGSRWSRIVPSVTWRPSSRAFVSVEPRVERRDDSWQYATTIVSAADPTYLFGTMRQRTTSLTARGSYVFTPDLSLQIFAQPFVSAGSFDQFKEVKNARARRFSDRFRTFEATAVRSTGMDIAIDRDGDGDSDLAFARPDFNRRELNANAVLRWEFRAGSTFFFVWSHGRRAADGDGSFDLGRDARRLFSDPSGTVLVAKLSYWLGR
jgi:hypothetical protein